MIPFKWTWNQSQRNIYGVKRYILEIKLKVITIKCLTYIQPMLSKDIFKITFFLHLFWKDKLRQCNEVRLTLPAFSTEFCYHCYYYYCCFTHDLLWSNAWKHRHYRARVLAYSKYNLNTLSFQCKSHFLMIIIWRYVIMLLWTTAFSLFLFLEVHKRVLLLYNQ
jgi:hypothetical protein